MPYRSTRARASFLRLESLEQRDTPAAAEFSGVHFATNGGTQVLMGHVADESLATLRVTCQFSDGTTVQVVPNAAGDFTRELPGNVQLQATLQANDNEGYTTVLDIDNTTPNSPPRILGLRKHGSGASWYVSGVVADENPAACYVHWSLSNGAEGDLPVDQDGNFSISFETTGPVTLRLTAFDEFGQPSGTRVLILS